MAIATILSLIVASHHSMSSTVTDPTDPLWVWFHGSMLPPMDALPAMIWFVVFSSAGAYGMINWANQYATGTLVMSYTVLQPVSAVILTVLLLALNAVRDCTDITTASKTATGTCLTPPNMGTFCCMVGVGIGLSLIILTEPKSDGRKKKAGVPISVKRQAVNKEVSI